MVTPGENEKFCLAGDLNVRTGRSTPLASKLTQRTLNELLGRIVLHFLPPYCPDAKARRYPPGYT